MSKEKLKQVADKLEPVLKTHAPAACHKDTETFDAATCEKEVEEMIGQNKEKIGEFMVENGVPAECNPFADGFEP